jgi:hypothetical protein
LKATKADIEGKITATSGKFTGEVQATSGKFTGEIQATSGKFTGEIQATSGTITNITATNLTANNILLEDFTLKLPDTNKNGIISYAKCGIKLFLTRASILGDVWEAALGVIDHWEVPEGIS